MKIPRTFCFNEYKLEMPDGRNWTESWKVGKTTKKWKKRVREVCGRIKSLYWVDTLHIHPCLNLGFGRAKVTSIKSTCVYVRLLFLDIKLLPQHRLGNGARSKNLYQPQTEIECYRKWNTPKHSPPERTSKWQERPIRFVFQALHDEYGAAVAQRLLCVALEWRPFRAPNSQPGWK